MFEDDRDFDRLMRIGWSDGPSAWKRGVFSALDGNAFRHVLLLLGMRNRCRSCAQSVPGLCARLALFREDFPCTLRHRLEEKEKMTPCEHGHEQARERTEPRRPRFGFGAHTKCRNDPSRSGPGPERTNRGSATLARDSAPTVN